MEYEIISKAKVCGRVKGEKLSESDIIASGGKIKFLLESGHIRKVGQTPKVVKEEIKEEPQVQVEEPKAFVFNNVKYEGDK